MKAVVVTGMVAVALLVGGLHIYNGVRASYEYNVRIGSYWDLSVKASTIPAKADYLNQFVAAVDSAHLEGNNAMVFRTPNNSYTENRKALGTLQVRLGEIRGMDVASFQYQQAISQITAQEQDEAGALLGTFKGIWYKNHHFWYWDWVGIAFGAVLWIGVLGILITVVGVATDV